jgi:hypothetical protein
MDAGHQIAYKLHYAIVDMALDGGAGGVESKYHILPQATHCEFITAVAQFQSGGLLVDRTRVQFEPVLCLFGH